MVGTSKILTVSYGTFSCTLEGFDDSFSTMKAIAEYFRGLAADDRYFGAEPPTPDAEMLAKIAEREISRRVDASMGDDGIHLRAAALTDQSVDASESAQAEHDKESRAEVNAARKAAKAAKKAERAQAKALKDAEKAAKAEAKAKAKALADAEKQAEADKSEAEAQAKADADAVKADADAKAEADAVKADADAKAEADAVKADADAVKADADAKAALDAKADANADSHPVEDVAATDVSNDDNVLSSASAAQAVTSEGTTGSKVEETRTIASSSTLAADDPAPASTPVTSTDAPVAKPDTESVAAKLRRIRAVVSNSEKATDAGSDDLDAQFLSAVETPDVAGFEKDDSPVAESDSLDAELVSEDAPKSDAAADDDIISHVVASNSTPTDTADADDAPVAETTAQLDVQADVEDVAPPRNRVIRMKRADFEKAKAEEPVQAVVPETAQQPTGTPDLGVLDGADELDDYLEDSDFADDMSFDDDADFSDDLAEIQADFEAAPQDEDVPKDATDTLGAVAAAMADQAAVDTSKADAEATAKADADARAKAEADAKAKADADARAKAEADAKAKADADARAKAEADAKAKADADARAKAEADAKAKADADARAKAEADAKAKADADARAKAEADVHQVDDASLNRLMTKTDAQLKEPEGSRRRDAIAQLKAAVAATEAARQVGEVDDGDQDVENAFRNDLSEATETESAPRQLAIAPPTARTDRQRPAPLKLVPAQRVDVTDAEETDAPVIPRRVVTPTADKVATSAGSFAEFAEDMGASQLPDLLEAAAAYTSFVEGAGEFSRPQILRQARAVASDEFNREDGLRSFADLLRAGRFTKVRNGRFQVADDSRYNPERFAG